MLVYSPGGSLAGLTSYWWSNSSVVSPKLQPAWKAARLAVAHQLVARRSGSSIHSSVGSVGREYSHEIRPRAKKFFDRSASRGFTPSGTVASFVSDVIGTSTTR